MSAARVGSADLELTAEVHAQLIAAFEQIGASVEQAITILSDDERSTCSVRTPAGQVHGVTVEQVLVATRRTFRAVCLCGWQSTLELSRPEATKAGAEHAASGH